jgi:hypothetical protein
MTDDGTARAMATAHDPTVKTVDNASIAELEAAIEAIHAREEREAYVNRVAGAEKKLERARAEVTMHEQELAEAQAALEEAQARWDLEAEQAAAIAVIEAEEGTV